MEEKAIFISVFRNKCPHCLKGNFFVTNNPYNLRRFDQQHKRCPHCGMDFVQEPGFYFGAAIMSYVIQVATVFLLYFFFQFMIELKIWHFIGVVAGTLFLLAPVTYRTARILWINILGKKPDAKA